MYILCCIVAGLRPEQWCRVDSCPPAGEWLVGWPSAPVGRTDLVTLHSAHQTRLHTVLLVKMILESLYLKYVVKKQDEEKCPREDIEVFRFSNQKRKKIHRKVILVWFLSVKGTNGVSQILHMNLAFYKDFSTVPNTEFMLKLLVLKAKYGNLI